MGESAEKSLLNMPGNVLLKICRDSDFPSIQSLRKVCQNLREFIDDNNIFCALPKVNIRAANDTITLKLHLNDVLPYPVGGLVTITYSKRGNDCLVSRGSTTRLVQQIRNKWYMRNDFHFRTFFNDFLTILKRLEGSMDTLEIFSEYQQDFDFYAEIRHDFVFRQQLIKTKSLRVDVLNSSDEFKFMIPVVDPEHFRKLEVVNSGTGNQMLSLGLQDTEQWRRLEEVMIREMQVMMYQVAAENIVALKQEFLRSEPPKHFHITSASFQERRRHVGLLGEPYENEEDTSRQWFYRVPRASHILQISISATILELKFIERDQVPVDAVIQNQ